MRNYRAFNIVFGGYIYIQIDAQCHKIEKMNVLHLILIWNALKLYILEMKVKKMESLDINRKDILCCVCGARNMDVCERKFVFFPPHTKPLTHPLSHTFSL